LILYKSGVSSGRYKGNTTNNIPPAGNRPMLPTGIYFASGKKSPPE